MNYRLACKDVAFDFLFRFAAWRLHLLWGTAAKKVLWNAICPSRKGRQVTKFSERDPSFLLPDMMHRRNSGVWAAHSCMVGFLAQLKNQKNTSRQICFDVVQVDFPHRPLVFRRTVYFFQSPYSDSKSHDSFLARLPSYPTSPDWILQKKMASEQCSFKLAQVSLNAPAQPQQQQQPQPLWRPRRLWRQLHNSKHNNGPTTPPVLDSTRSNRPPSTARFHVWVLMAFSKFCRQAWPSRRRETGLLRSSLGGPSSFLVMEATIKHLLQGSELGLLEAKLRLLEAKLRLFEACSQVIEFVNRNASLRARSLACLKRICSFKNWLRIKAQHEKQANVWLLFVHLAVKHGQERRGQLALLKAAARGPTDLHHLRTFVFGFRCLSRSSCRQARPSRRLGSRAASLEPATCQNKREPSKLFGNGSHNQAPPSRLGAWLAWSEAALAWSEAALGQNKRRPSKLFGNGSHNQAPPSRLGAWLAWSEAALAWSEAALGQNKREPSKLFGNGSHNQAPPSRLGAWLAWSEAALAWSEAALAWSEAALGQKKRRPSKLFGNGSHNQAPPSRLGAWLAWSEAALAWSEAALVWSSLRARSLACLKRICSFKNRLRIKAQHEKQAKVWLSLRSLCQRKFGATRGPNPGEEYGGQFEPSQLFGNGSPKKTPSNTSFRACSFALLKRNCSFLKWMRSCHRSHLESC